MNTSCPPAAPPSLSHILDQLVPVAADLADLAHRRGDRELARLAATALSTVADLHAVAEHLATLAGVPDAQAGRWP